MMGKRWMYLVVVTLGLLLILVIGPGLAHGPEEQAQPQGTMAIEAVSSWYTYQGMLRENGVPVTGSRYIVFTFYADDACTVPYDDFWDTVEVNEGLFSVKLPGGSYYFDGRAVWLGMEIDGTTVGCQEILPVPYALSLRPGADIASSMDGAAVLYVRNSSSYDGSKAVQARAGAMSGETYGVWAESDSTDGAAVYARGWDHGADLILGSNGSTGIADNGVVTSDPSRVSSDIVLETNDTIRIDLDNDGDGENAGFEIYDKDDQLIFDVDESGQVTFGGAGIAAYPRPAYDSGWVAIAAGTTETLSHNLYGNVDKYVVDLQFDGLWGRHQRGFGDSAWWFDLTDTSIKVTRASGDSIVDEVRVRIWVYP